MLLALCDLGFGWRRDTILPIVIVIVYVLALDALDLRPPKHWYKHGQFVRSRNLA
jgi:hypothetical protein